MTYVIFQCENGLLDVKKFETPEQAENFADNQNGCLVQTQEEFTRMIMLAGAKPSEPSEN